MKSIVVFTRGCTKFILIYKEHKKKTLSKRKFTLMLQWSILVSLKKIEYPSKKIMCKLKMYGEFEYSLLLFDHINIFYRKKKLCSLDSIK